MTVLFYLGGDSYPHEAGFEAQLSRRFQQQNGLTMIGQSSMYSGDELTRGDGRSISQRLSRLDALVGLFSEPVVLMGRSSGARIASLYACQHEVAAVICFAYPFQPSGEPLQPERYIHLAGAKTPTLIIQGKDDRYGGVAILDKYKMSEAVQVKFIDADHEFGLAPALFEEVFNFVGEFIESL